MYSYAPTWPPNWRTLKLATPLKMRCAVVLVTQAGHFEPVVEPDDERDDYQLEVA